jgi:PAS domain S-box-containing protein
MTPEQQMSRSLRILHLEDNPRDAELAAAMLESDGIVADIVRVDTREAFVAAVEGEPFDLILADYQLPSFDGLAAQALAAFRRPGTPFIFLSGTLGEEVAIERLKAGATDYVLKQRMVHLPSSVRRALADAVEREERLRAETEVRRLNAELEQRVHARTSELARANHELGAAQRFLNSIVENIPAMVFVKDATDLRFVRLNLAGEQLLGHAREFVLGKTDHDLFPPVQARAFVAKDREVLGGSSIVDIPSEAIYTKGGTVRTVHTRKIPLADDQGRPAFLLGISEDITERKKAEDTVKMARLEAERANRAKSDFLSRMSHDLRTPLNAVLGFAQLLEADELTSEQHENVRQILRGGRHLLSLINEVLDIARIEAGHLSLSPEPVDVVEIVQHAVALVAPLAAQREIALTVEAFAGVACCVQADRQRLNQVLLNLLSNAVKYTHSGGRVTVAFEARPPDRMRVKVSDTGAGIPPEKLEMLFTPFERLGAERTSIEGTGLGLALARGLAGAMGGSLGVSSEVDRGSTFWIELARSGDQAVSASDAAAAPRGLTRRFGAGTVLYIEDNASNVRLMERVLQKRAGVRLLHAAEGQLGIDMARANRPGLILLDLHLPDLTGEEVLRRLWEDPVLRAIPVAVLSADATPAQSRRLLASGAKAYLTKPLDVAQVLALIDEWLLDGGAAEARAAGVEARADG